MKVSITVRTSQERLQALLEGLVLLNVIELRDAPLPPLYRAGVQWRAEPSGQENWQTCDRVFAQRFGDCEDLATWRAAELRLRGDEAIAVPYRAGFTRAGGRLWHVIVQRADGSYEDPSRLLGMGADRNG